MSLGAAAKTNLRAELGPPDMAAIAAASVDETSQYYYPKLLKSFMANDTTMTATDFQYFYYGTMFQEDYDPYREAPNPALLQELMPIYAKAKRTRADRGKMLDYAMQVLDDNPIDLRQLTNRIYVYEQNGKYDLAKIWQYKLNHILEAIVSTGTGLDEENAWIVINPQHEYNLLNFQNYVVKGHEDRPPYYDYIIVEPNGKKGATEGFYFNVLYMLQEYYRKFPEPLK